MKHTCIATALALSLAISTHAHAKDSQTNPPKPTSIKEKTVKKTATAVGRQAAGAAIGGTVGKIVSGGAAGFGIGLFLTPTEIGCGKGETCAR